MCGHSGSDAKPSGHDFVPKKEVGHSNQALMDSKDLDDYFHRATLECKFWLSGAASLVMLFAVKRPMSA
jgi:hypothetical protein